MNPPQRRSGILAMDGARTAPCGGSPQRLVEKLISRARAEPQPLIERSCPSVADRELQLQPNAAALREVRLRGSQQPPPGALPAFLGQHEELIDLAHQALMLDTHQEHDDEITRERAPRLRDPDRPALCPPLEQLLQHQLDAQGCEVLDAFEIPVTSNESQQLRNVARPGAADLHLTTPPGLQRAAPGYGPSAL